MDPRGLEALLDTLAEDEELFSERDSTPENIDHVPVDDIVSVYFRQMAAEPLLTAEQEVALAKRIERGIEAQKYLDTMYDELAPEDIESLEALVLDGQAAREHMAAANTRLVVSIAKRYTNRGLPMSDLIQEGNIGLMKAVDKFDYKMGNRFSTYATWWIRQTITRALAQKSRTIRLPLHRSDELRRINSAYETLEKELGREPTYKEIGKYLDLAPAKVRDMIESTPQTVPLETPVGDDNELGDFLEDEDMPDPDELMDTTALEETIDRLLSQMIPREAQILRLRFGLKNGNPQTLQQVGKVMGLSRERIRQLEYQAIRRLREPQFAAILRDFLAM